MKRPLIILFFILAAAICVSAQVTTLNARRLSSGTAVPSGACTVGPPYTQVYIRTTDQSIYECTGVSTWTKVVSGGTPISGSGTSGQVAYWNGTSSITGSAGLKYDGTELGIGWGPTTPTSGPMLAVASTISTSPRGILSAQYSTDTAGARVGFQKARGTIGTPTTVVTGDTLGRLMFRGYDGSNYLEMGSIEVTSTGTIAATRVPTTIMFSTATNATPSVLTTALTLGADQSATFAGNTTIAGTLTVTDTQAAAPASLVFRNTGASTGISGSTFEAQLKESGDNVFAIFTADNSPLVLGINNTETLRFAATTGNATFSVPVAAAIHGAASNSTTAIKFTKADLSTVVGVWDTTNTRLRVGSGVAPTATLDVTGAALISSTLGVSSTLTGIDAVFTPVPTTGNGFAINSSTVTSGNTVAITASGTAAASNTKTALNVATSGANATSAMTTYGAQIANTSSGTTSVNVGLKVTSSSGATNIGIMTDSIQGTGTTTSTPLLTLRTDSNRLDIARASDGSVINGQVYAGRFGVSNGNDFAYLNTVGLQLTSAALITWSSTTNNPASSLDTGISRDGAASFDFGNGTAASKTGTLNFTALVASGATQTWSNAAFTTCTALTTVSNVMGCTASDKNLKQDFHAFSNGLEFIRSVTAETYSFKSGTPWYDGGRTRLGLIAQDVQKMLPQAVFPIGPGQPLQIDYNAVVAALLDALKQSDARITALENTLKIKH